MINQNLRGQLTGGRRQMIGSYNQRTDKNNRQINRPHTCINIFHQQLRIISRLIISPCTHALRNHRNNRVSDSHARNNLKQRNIICHRICRQSRSSKARNKAQHHNLPKLKHTVLQAVGNSDKAYFSYNLLLKPRTLPPAQMDVQTLIAQKHYNNFVQRMKDFPVNIGLLCRFRSAAEQKKTIGALKAGQLDIVIGTHRLLSKDVVYKNLGLLVIDEEQRFGVAHKEKIKQLKTNIDVLTLTATPIPRTLHMSLIGIRDMSVLEEPPMDRLPIQTYVMEYNEELVREAISRELSRGGQAYYVYNRVREIGDVAAKVAELVPEAVVAFAHGQMRETELENIMYRFINGEIDVLVSTTIIETGLDISNVNTMIIHDADNMGLSQLYQLRGRVGRSSRTAYAFLMYRRDKMLKEIAEKRLAAIREYTELGSGFKIAMRDLEIRGAGNLLGAEQHGHMEAVGYDLYCKMLNEAVKEAKGITAEEQFDTSIDIEIDAYIPMGYIPNEFQKLDIYKRIAGITSDEEAAEMTDELTDRFGDLPKSVENLLFIAKVKSLAHQVYVTDICQKGDTLKFTLYEKARIDAAKIQPFLLSYGPRLKFTADAKAPYFTLLLKSPGSGRKLPSQRTAEVPGILESFLRSVRDLLLPQQP